MTLYSMYFYYHTTSGFGGLEVACWPLVPKWSTGSLLAFGTQVRGWPKPSEF